MSITISLSPNLSVSATPSVALDRISVVLLLVLVKEALDQNQFQYRVSISM